MDSASTITQLLASMSDGDAAAGEQVLPLVYDELRIIARSQLRSSEKSQALETTALVHEAYMRLFAGKDAEWASRKHFYATAAKAMRQILIDQFRRRNAGKRGAGLQQVTLQGLDDQSHMGAVDFIAFDQALTQLDELDPRLSEVLHLRFFAGLEVDEVAEMLNVSRSTVVRDWRKARAFLDTVLSP